MNLKFLFVFVSFLFSFDTTQCKEILAVFPHPGKSHFYMYEPYIVKLADRGHNITMISVFKLSKPHKNIEVLHLAKEQPSTHLNLAEYEAASSLPKIFIQMIELSLLNQWGVNACETGLTDPKVKALLKSNKHFDAVMVEYFNTDCFAVFSHIFKAPLIAIFSSGPAPWHNDRMGNPDNPSYVPSLFTTFPTKMNFFQRMENTLTTLYAKIYTDFIYNKASDGIIKKYLGKGYPKVKDIVKNTSLFLVNSHFSMFQSRPLVPNVVEVGGLHVQPPKSVPADLEKYFTESKNGVVYFSLGTVTKGYTLPVKRRDAIMKAFSKIPQNVLWKWEDDNMPGKPVNVLIKKWVPQNDVLAHPKVKVFVTHCGLMGLLEAATYGVPIIGIPLFGDQPSNCALLAEKGVGVVLDYFTLTEQALLNALKMVLENKSYAENAKLLSATFNERPLTAMNNAIYWTEYVLKFKGAPHLSSAARNLPWYSEYLIDVFLFIIVFLTALVYCCKKIICKLIEIKKSRKKDAKNKKNK